MTGYMYVAFVIVTVDVKEIMSYHYIAFRQKTSRMLNGCGINVWGMPCVWYTSIV
jgi:hypothetical protein